MKYTKCHSLIISAGKLQNKIPPDMLILQNNPLRGDDSNFASQQAASHHHIIDYFPITASCFILLWPLWGLFLLNTIRSIVIKWYMHLWTTNQCILISSSITSLSKNNKSILTRPWTISITFEHAHKAPLLCQTWSLVMTWTKTLVTLKVSHEHACSHSHLDLFACLFSMCRSLWMCLIAQPDCVMYSQSNRIDRV